MKRANFKKILGPQLYELPEGLVVSITINSNFDIHLDSFPSLL